MFEGLIKPGLNFLEIAHDEDCPGRFENGRGCCCKPDVRLHTDENRYISGELKNRAARRAAAREAARAMRKARKAAP